MQPSTSLSNKPSPPLLAVGSSLIVLGAALLPSVFLTVVGIACIVAGIGVLIAAYVRSARHSH